MPVHITNTKIESIILASTHFSHRQIEVRKWDAVSVSFTSTLSPEVIVVSNEDAVQFANALLRMVE